jgi:AcrR family transcriptional regulator
MATRMDPADRRDAIVAAALRVMRRKGMATTTVRDVAAEMETSSGLIHHYFPSMDDVLASAFERAAVEDLAVTEAAMASGDGALEELTAFFASYARADQDPTFQLWLDAWAEASRRPAVQETSRRLNLEWQQLLATTIRHGVGTGVFECREPDAAAWRILSLLDGLALQAVAHRALVDRAAVIRWSLVAAEMELGLAEGSLAVPSSPAEEVAHATPRGGGAA